MYIKTTPRYLYRPMRMTLIKMRNNIKKVVSAVISYTYTYTLFHILFYYDLLQDTEYSSLCYTVGPCCSPVSYIVVCILYDSTVLCNVLKHLSKPTECIPTMNCGLNVSIFFIK